jgi:hypothetical protein
MEQQRLELEQQLLVQTTFTQPTHLGPQLQEL